MISFYAYVLSGSSRGLGETVARVRPYPVKRTHKFLSFERNVNKNMDSLTMFGSLQKLEMNMCSILERFYTAVMICESWCMLQVLVPLSKVDTI